MKNEQNFQLGDIVYYFSSITDYGKALIAGIQENTIVPTAGDYFFNVPKKEYYISKHGFENFLNTKVLDYPVKKYMLVDRCFTKLFDNHTDFNKYVIKAVKNHISALEEDLEDKKKEMNNEISRLEEDINKQRNMLSLLTNQ